MFRHCSNLLHTFIHFILIVILLSKYLLSKYSVSTTNSFILQIRKLRSRKKVIFELRSEGCIS